MTLQNKLALVYVLASEDIYALVGSQGCKFVNSHKNVCQEIVTAEVLV